MLTLTFKVKVDKEGKIVGISKTCNVPRPTCDGCKFKDICDRIRIEYD